MSSVKRSHSTGGFVSTFDFFSRFQLTRIESNLLFSFIASYTFSGINASFLESLSFPLPFGVDVVDVDDSGDETNSRKKMIL